MPTAADVLEEAALALAARQGDTVLVERISRLCVRLASPFKWSCNMEQLPGCCGTVVSSGVYIVPELRGKGLGGRFADYRIAVARHAGFGTILATTTPDCRPEDFILAKRGFQPIAKWINPRSGNEVTTWQLVLEGVARKEIY